MAIPDFSTLLTNALKGETKALVRWNFYVKNKILNETEIKQTVQAIQKIVIEDASKRSHRLTLEESHALILKAQFYANGLLGPEPNYAQAMALYKEAIKVNNSNAMTGLAYMYQYGKGVERDYGAAIRLYEQAIAEGNSTAMNNLGYIYLHGLSNTPDYPAAVKLFNQAIALGNTSSMLHRSNMYRTGLGGEHSLAKAIPLVDKACELGDLDALNLRATYYMGAFDRSKPDYDKAIPLLEQAIHLQHTAAMVNLAYIYVHDTSRLDYKKAKKLYEIAIEKGNSEGMFWRAYMYQHGLSTKKNLEKAIELYKKSYESGNIDAKAQLEKIQQSTEFISKSHKSPASTSQAEKNLSHVLKQYEMDCNILLDQLKHIKDSLNKKSLSNDRYTTIASDATNLYETFKLEIEAFFKKPSAKKFQACYKNCERFMAQALKNANEHRGWYQINKILRGILGLLAAIAILPAILVEYTSGQGYIKTFFTKPNTRSHDNLMEMKSKFDEMFEGITQSLDT